MAINPPLDLGRRERQIMETVVRLGRASVQEVRAQLSDPPSYSSVRAILRILEQKGHVRHTEDGNRYIYHPATLAHDLRGKAIRHMLRTFFGGSRTAVLAALLESTGKIGEQELDAFATLIDKARQHGRRGRPGAEGATRRPALRYLDEARGSKRSPLRVAPPACPPDARRTRSRAPT